MISSYANIYSKFLGLIKSIDFIKLSQEDAYTLMKDYLENTMSRPNIRRLFSSFSVDEEYEQINYELKEVIDEEYSKRFVENMFANGMVVGWLEPKLHDDIYLQQFFGTKEQKYYSQAAHIDSITTVVNNAKKELNKTYARNYGYSNLVMK